MQGMSPKSRFDAYASVLQFDAASVEAIRHSINHLLKDVSELVRKVDVAMKAEGAPAVVGDLGGETRERLQSLLASFIMRTINCNYDEDFCNYAVEISHAEDVPATLFPLGLGIAMDYVAQTLPGRVEDPQQLAKMLTAWNRLTGTLRELTRK
ncbi:MAG: protoglobin family protein [Planctomycetes bacterium]|nr:protoglobin family protein [Planctomycetota bacterium]